jgi:hypothetical protein
MSLRHKKPERIAMLLLDASSQYLVRESRRLFVFDWSDIQLLILPRFLDLRGADGFFMG